MLPEWTIANDFRLDGLAAEVPHLSEYFGLWSILEEPFRAAVGRVNGLDLTVHVQQTLANAAQSVQPRAASGGRDHQVTDQGVTIVPLVGPMMKYVSSLSDGCSTILARRQIRSATADDLVKAIVLHIDSPGGTVAGTYDLAADVAAAAKQKSVIGYIEDLGASAAYAVAAQCSKLYANATALVGAIGTYGVIYDQSKRAEKLGLTVHVLRAGAFKGAGTAGSEITAEQLAEWQRVIDELNAHFIAGVARGRRLSDQQVRELADGRVHLAAEAVKLGLIDGVQTLDQTLSSAVATNQLSSNQSRSNQTMSETQDAKKTTEAAPIAAASTQPAAADFEQLKAGCVGADSEFICAQLAAKATISQATSAWMAEQNKRIKAQQAETEQAKAAAKKPGFDIPGEGTGSGSQATESGDAIEQFDAAVTAKMQAGMDRPKAVLAVARANPQLHADYIRETNADRGKAVTRMVEEKYG